ncbi:glutamate--tRNA ligase [Clostridium aestuarii]|uniref:Glutamate--tRNA ligase n=1 Tax=Clostridium aestuarii TaxID=338193 RepID=A0ABT4D1V9_9CLOT|nr:glutamate--tRNA ligase [Clostridium aestuarii]MCY6484627.1 glutamate--tRNA ligase [Clostridium aestuarii]
MGEREVRTRFAPSPTGYMHIGNLRTALYTYLIAKHEDGKFILRIEDTDQERYVEGAVDVIYRTLKMTGLNHDEGPDVGGPVGPYIQSERKGTYLGYAKQLVEKGEAYYVFSDKPDVVAEISEKEKKPYKYNAQYHSMTKEEIEEKLVSGISYVIRQKNPSEGVTVFEDEIYGTIKVDNLELEDMILIKSDGLPTYNFANVVDDHLMEITHIVRGNEYLSSAPKYNRLYSAFGWPVPTYVHCPPIMKDAHNKLSKRNGDASFEDLLAKGYLKEAVVNFIALLGWSSGTDQEIFTLEELIEKFDYRHINKSPAIFDDVKLKWMNGEYIKKLPLEDFHKRALSYYEQVFSKETMEKIDLLKISELLQTRVEVLNEIPEKITFFESVPEYDISLYIHKRMKTNPENSLPTLERVLPVLEKLEDWSLDSIHNTIFDLIKEMEVKNGVVLWPIRTVLSGEKSTPGGAFELAEILGKEESLRRIRVGIEKLKNEI